MTEREFHGVVERWLRQRYDHVEHEPTLPSDREPDFVVKTPLCTFLIEVEFHPEDVTDDVIHGAGQVLEYAGEWGLDHDGFPSPIVIPNAEAVDMESREIRSVQEWMPVVPIPAAGGGA